MKLDKKREIRRKLKERNMGAIETTVYSISKVIDDNFMECLYFIEPTPIHAFLELEYCCQCPKVVEEIQVMIDKGEITQDEKEEYEYFMNPTKCENPNKCDLYFKLEEEIKACIYEDYKIKTPEEHKLEYKELLRKCGALEEDLEF